MAPLQLLKVIKLFSWLMFQHISDEGPIILAKSACFHAWACNFFFRISDSSWSIVHLFMPWLTHCIAHIYQQLRCNQTLFPSDSKAQDGKAKRQYVISTLKIDDAEFEPRQFEHHQKHLIYQVEIGVESCMKNDHNNLVVALMQIYRLSYEWLKNPLWSTLFNPNGICERCGNMQVNVRGGIENMDF